MSRKILILGESIGFPIGLAATARVRCIAKALIETGWKVEVVNSIGLAGSYTGVNVSAKGSYEGIPYRFCSGRPVRPKNKLLRLLEKVIGESLCLLFVCGSIIKGQADCLLVYSRNSKFLTRIGIVGKLFRVPVIAEVCEWPEAIASTKGRGLRKAKRFRRALVRYSDAVIPISTYILEQIQRSQHTREIPSLILPILFDYETGTVDANRESPSYIFYSGSSDYVNISKTVIDTAYILKSRGLNVPIVMTSPGRKESVDFIRSYISEKNLEDTVKFLGYITDRAYIDMVTNAAVLLAPVPNDLQSVARFPTKLAFYLASGRPVITSNVGEIKRYLEGTGAAYILNPDFTPAELADKILEALSDPAGSDAIGAKGKKLAYKNFYYKAQSQKLAEFISDVIQKYASAVTYV